jgi:hypothetical protein
MIPKEEIEQLAEIHANREMEVYKSMDLPKGTKQAIFTHCLVSYNIAYTQCQEDMADKKYTEEDLRKAFNSGVSSGWNAQENKEAINADEYIQSLNKQD